MTYLSALTTLETSMLYSHISKFLAIFGKVLLWHVCGPHHVSADTTRRSIGCGRSIASQMKQCLSRLDGRTRWWCYLSRLQPEWSVLMLAVCSAAIWFSPYFLCQNLRLCFWGEYISGTLIAIPQIWHKHSVGLKDEVIRLCLMLMLRYLCHVTSFLSVTSYESGFVRIYENWDLVQGGTQQWRGNFSFLYHDRYLGTKLTSSISACSYLLV